MSCARLDTDQALGLREGEERARKEQPAAQREVHGRDNHLRAPRDETSGGVVVGEARYGEVAVR